MALALPGVPAQADDPLLLCTTGNEVVTYSLGLRLFTQTVTLSYVDVFSGCVSDDPILHYGVVEGEYELEASCTSLDPVPAGAQTVWINWDKGDQSQMTVTTSQSAPAARPCSPPSAPSTKANSPAVRSPGS